jgi:hypothetical protein
MRNPGNDHDYDGDYDENEEESDDAEFSLSGDDISSGEDVVLGYRPFKIIEIPGYIVFFDPEREEGVVVSGDFKNTSLIDDVLDDCYKHPWVSVEFVDMLLRNHAGSLRGSGINIDVAMMLHEIPKENIMQEKEENNFDKPLNPGKNTGERSDHVENLNISFTNANPDLVKISPEEYDLQERTKRHNRQIETAQKTGSEKFNDEEWKTKAAPLTENIWIKKQEAFPYYDEMLKHDFGDMVVVFGINHHKESLNETRIRYECLTRQDGVLRGDYDLNGNFDIAKKIVENIINDHDIHNHTEMDGSLVTQRDNQYYEHIELETAKKTGYVQGVCESVLAFNTGENRKIMSESTMNFLSKKLLSEMNVTRDTARKFANPETYKALEQSVFAPEQERRLEQTRPRGRST